MEAINCQSSLTQSDCARRLSPCSDTDKLTSLLQLFHGATPVPEVLLWRGEHDDSFGLSIRRLESENPTEEDLRVFVDFRRLRWQLASNQKYIDSQKSNNKQPRAKPSMAFKLQTKIRDLIPFQLEINGNFSVWKYCMTCVLVSLNLLGYVDGSLEDEREGLEVGGERLEDEEEGLEDEDQDVDHENEALQHQDEDFEGLQHQDEDFEGLQHQDEVFEGLQHQDEVLEGLQHQNFEGLQHQQQHQDDLEDAENRRQRRDCNDKAVMALINSTLAPCILAQVTHCSSSRSLWLKLESIFYGRKELKVRALENKLKSLKRARPFSMETYISEVEKLRAELASLGKELSLDELRAIVLQNLEPHFRTAVQNREIPSSINEFYLLLLLEEAQKVDEPRLDYYS